MLVKHPIFFPTHLLLHLKKSIQNTIIFWIYSPFGVIKKVLSELFFLKREGNQLLFYFFVIKPKSGRDAVLTQTTLLSNIFVGLSRKYRIDL
jgi:hypothetical protein